MVIGYFDTSAPNDLELEFADCSKGKTLAEYICVTLYCLINHYFHHVHSPIHTGVTYLDLESPTVQIWRDLRNLILTLHSTDARSHDQLREEDKTPHALQKQPDFRFHAFGRLYILIYMPMALVGSRPWRHLA